MSSIQSTTQSLRPIRDAQLRWLGPAILFVFGAFFFRFSIYFGTDTNPEQQLHFLVVGLTSGYLCWNVARWVIVHVQKKYRCINQTQKRHFLLIVLVLPVLAAFGYGIRYAGHALWNQQFVLPDMYGFTYAMGIQLFYYCVYIGIYEGIYLFRQWRRTYRKNEELLQINWQTRFDSLKSQVNPHFLFNSLNTLSSLIGEDARQAENFVDEMAKVYRYLLQSNTKQLTTLRLELQFIQSYFHLLQTRYGQGVSIQLCIDDAHQEWLIPPLTLQLLVENAVKHNVILPEHPLKITIRSTKTHELVVSNNLQRKDLRVPSHRLGLINIATKYELLGEYEILICEESSTFTITMPLIPVTEKMAHV